MAMDCVRWEKHFEKRNAEFLSPLIQEHIACISLQPECHVLDIGCATGRVTHDYILPALPDTAVVYAIDNDLDSIRRAKEKYDKSGIRFVCLDALNVSTLKVKFDLVVSFNCFHLIPDQLSLWKALKSVLTENGSIVTLTPTKCIKYDAFLELSQSAEYCQYLYDLDTVYASDIFSKDLSEAVSSTESVIKKVFQDKPSVIPIKPSHELVSREVAESVYDSINLFRHRMSDATAVKYVRDWVSKMIEKLGNNEDKCTIFQEMLLIKIQRSR